MKKKMLVVSTIIVLLIQTGYALADTYDQYEALNPGDLGSHDTNWSGMVVNYYNHSQQVKQWAAEHEGYYLSRHVTFDPNHFPDPNVNWEHFETKPAGSCSGLGAGGFVWLNSYENTSNHSIGNITTTKAVYTDGSTGQATDITNVCGTTSG